MKTSKDKYDDDATYQLYADFVDASGLRGKTRVQINGIDVGKIQDIKHARTDRGRLIARVELRIMKEFELYEDASVSKTAESLLGDFRLDIEPGTPDYPVIKEGGLIKRVQSVSDLQEIQIQLKQGAKNLNDLSDTFKRVLSGPEGEGSLKAILQRVERSMGAIERATGALDRAIGQNDQIISQVIQDIGVVSHRLAEVSSPNGDLTQMAENMARLSGRMNEIADSVNDIVSGELADWEAGSSLKATLENVNESLTRLNAIARKVDEGQGTAGRLINDPAIAEKVEQTLDDTSEIIGGLSRLQTHIELRSEYAVPFGKDNELVQAAIKNYLGLRLQPKPDKYYYFEAVSDPRGKQSRTVTSTTTEGGSTQKVEETVISFDDLKFSAQFAKRYYFLTLRFGIIENTGGLGANLHVFDDQMELHVDLFDFTRRDPDRNETIFPRLRTFAMYEFMSHLYVQAGLDDPFNPRLRTWFVGGSLRFTDDDLKALLTVAPTP
ncbi:MlaD family protein [Myxococcota bacterium]